MSSAARPASKSGPDGDSAFEENSGVEKCAFAMNSSQNNLANGDGRPWLVRFRPNPSAALRLFCFPYAGVGASIFSPWVHRLHSKIEMVGVQLPGREGRIREEPFDRLSRIVPEAARFIRNDLDRPYAIFGHSLGALIGFEVARCLRREGAPDPVHLFLSARRAPPRPDPLPEIHGLPDAEFLEEIQRRWDGIPSAVLREAELLQLLLPALRADVAVLETYTHLQGEPLDCPISVFGGENDRNIGREDLLGWRGHTRGDFRLRLLPGGHFFIRTQQQALLEAMSDDILQALGRGKESGKC
ncbi:MAG: gramicidin dehydrogenase [Deltaproteobacteria bacterium]|nr:gramicidin dehydrogenase [Deltaproteobacteria bacterium]